MKTKYRSFVITVNKDGSYKGVSKEYPKTFNGKSLPEMIYLINEYLG